MELRIIYDDLEAFLEYFPSGKTMLSSCPPPLSMVDPLSLNQSDKPTVSSVMNKSIVYREALYLCKQRLPLATLAKNTNHQASTSVT